MSGRMSPRSGSDFRTPENFFSSTSTQSGNRSGHGSAGPARHAPASAPSRRADDDAGLALVRRDLDARAIDDDRTVAHQLARFGARGGETHAVHDVVEARLEDLQQRLARGARTAGRLLVVAAELALEHAVHAAQLLLLAQLQAIARHARAALALDAARRHFELALRLERLDAALQEEVGALATRELALRTQIPCHVLLSSAAARQTRRFLGGRHRCAGSASRPRCW